MARVSGGDKIDAALAAIGERFGVKDALQVGFLDGRTYPDGTSVPLIAFINEYGRRIGDTFQPPRPFFRNMIAANSPQWAEQIAAILQRNGGDGAAALALMGEVIKGELQQSIRDLTDPPLAASTIKKKGFAKPLIDSSVMINSVGYVVKE